MDKKPLPKIYEEFDLGGKISSLQGKKIIVKRLKRNPDGNYVMKEETTTVHPPPSQNPNPKQSGGVHNKNQMFHSTSKVYNDFTDSFLNSQLTFQESLVKGQHKSKADFLREIDEAPEKVSRSQMFTSFNPQGQPQIQKKEAKLSVDNRLPSEINQFLNDPNVYKQKVEQMVKTQRDLAFNQIDQIMRQMEQFLNREKEKIQANFTHYQNECLRNLEIYNDMCKKFISTSSE